MKLLHLLALIAALGISPAEAARGVKPGKAPVASVPPALPAPNTQRNPYESQIQLTGEHPIDRLVLAQLQKLAIEPAKVCSDAVFVRRVYLDVIGTLPTALEAKTFLLDQSPNKRRALIDTLLQRDEFADYWTMRWCDLLRVKAEFPINLWPNAVQAYHHWIRTSLQANLPYDKFARELLTANGSNFRVGQVNFYRAVQTKTPQGMAEGVALTFLGSRADKWPAGKLDGMAAFFSYLSFKDTLEWKEEIVFHDPAKSNAQAVAVFPDGTRARLAPDRDPREAFADWLVNPQNPWFAKVMANRAWYWLLGRGIVHEPDDWRTDNPPVNPELLSLLEKEFISGHYDVKQLFRFILNSKTYQLASVSKSKNAAAEANFACYPLRRLEAEVLIDALNQITGTSEKYSSPIPEPFTFIPEDQRAIALADGSITSSFLELFGRPPRDTGLTSERNNRPSPNQRLHLLNSSHIQRKLEQSPRFRAMFQNKGSTPAEMVNGIYLACLSRFPTEAESRAVAAYVKDNATTSREGLLDLAWALINSPEFLYRH